MVLNQPYATLSRYPKFYLQDRNILYIAIDMDTIIDTIFFIIGSLSVVDICTDWTGVYSRLAGLRTPNTFVRIVMKVVWGALILFAWIILKVILELLLQ